jgi:CDP-diacylglycerol--serine O-phosphatidyltransferase
MIKQIPNVFTLLNLFFGCLAIICIVQPGIIITQNDGYKALVDVPEKMIYGSLFIGIAAVIDFLDGFVARALKATSEIGKQLDSLADVVSFGVAPGMIVFQFLRLSFASEMGGLEVSTAWLSLAFIIPCAGAYRLARFNIDITQSTNFKGVPIPAAGLFIAAFPLIYWYNTNQTILNILTNKWFWYGIILFISYLMISTLPMLALKFKGVNFKKLLPFIIVLAVGLLTSFLLGFIGIATGFLTYVLVSLIFGVKN